MNLSEENETTSPVLNGLRNINALSANKELILGPGKSWSQWVAEVHASASNSPSPMSNPTQVQVATGPGTVQTYSRTEGSPQAQASSNQEYVRSDPQKVVVIQSSYWGKAFIALVLYYLGFFVIGLIANLIFLSEANRDERISGYSPSGKGCLGLLLFFHLGLVALLACAVILVPGAIATFFNSLH